MMGKIVKSGRSFKGCVEYCMLKNKAEVLFADGVRADDIRQTIADFNMQRKMNADLGQAVGHIALNFSPEDAAHLTGEKMLAIAHEYLDKMKIRDTQILIVKHNDTRHPHLHIVYNRVNNQAKTIKDSMQRWDNVKVSKALTLKHGLHMSKGKQHVNRLSLKGPDQAKYQLYDAIKAVSQKARSMDELQQQLKKQGIGMQYKYKSGTREVQGISFSKGQYKFKGSEIDRSMSYSRLNAAINQRIAQEQQQARPSLADQLRERIRENSKQQAPVLSQGTELWAILYWVRCWSNPILADRPRRMTAIFTGEKRKEGAACPKTMKVQCTYKDQNLGNVKSLVLWKVKSKKN